MIQSHNISPNFRVELAIPLFSRTNDPVNFVLLQKYSPKNSKVYFIMLKLVCFVGLGYFLDLQTPGNEFEAVFCDSQCSKTVGPVNLLLMPNNTPRVSRTFLSIGQD